MSTYDDASLIYYPSGYKASKAYSLKPTDGSGDLDFTRASTATRVNESGLIEEVAANVPRLNTPLSGGCSSLLLEPQRTNTLLNSEDLNSWLKLDTSVTSNSTTSPDGTTNADTVTATGAGSLSHLVYQNLAFVSGSSYTLSVFAKANTSNYIQLVFAGNLIANSYANFDLSSGTITASAFVTAKIENYGSGWYRCSISATSAASTTNSQIIYLINSPTASRGQSFVQSGESVYLWGGSFENGSFPTSYIPTTSTAVTRVVDGLSVSSLFSKGIVGVNGSLFVDINTLNLSGLTFTMWNTLSQRSGVIRFTSASNTFYIGLLEGGSGSTQISLGSLPPRAKLLFRKNGNTYTLFYNGVKASTDMTAPAQTWDKLEVESGFSPNMTVNSVILFNSALSDTDAIALTTI